MTSVTTARCEAAGQDDHSDCVGPHDAVTVVIGASARRPGCHHHAALILATVQDSRVLPGSVAGAVLTVYRDAEALMAATFLSGRAAS